MRIRSMFCVLALASTAHAANAQAPQWPVSNPVHLAIFCGAPETETSHAYSQALSTALTALTSRGATVQEAMKALEGRAKCNVVLSLAGQGAPK